MEDVKPWYASKGIWGSIIVIAAMGLKVAGIEISPDDQATAVDMVVKGASSVADLVALGGGVIALWGRLRASTKIGKPA
jgi:hypothetical protein